MIEPWFLYVIAAVIIWGLNAIVDKFILTKHLNPFSYLVSYLPVSIIIIIGILIFIPFTFKPFPFFVAFFAGIIGVVGYYLYCFAVKKEETSRIAALTAIYPAIVAVLAVFLVNEIFPIKSYFGIIFMILGTVLISYKRNILKKIIPISIILMVIGANFSYAFEQTISKISLESYSFFSFFIAYLFGRFFTLLPVLAVPTFRRNFVKEMKGLKRKTILLLGIATTFWTFAGVFFFYAASIGPITLVSAISIMSPFVALLFATCVSKFWPNILKEEIDRKTLLLKAIAVFLIFVGIYLIVV